MLEKNILIEGRRKKKQQGLEQKNQILNGQLEVEQTIHDGLESELAENGVPTQAELRKDRFEGILYLFFATSSLVGMIFLIELSLRTFLPQSDFPIFWQRVLSAIFGLGTVVSFHQWFLRNEENSTPLPRWFLWSFLLCFVIGLSALAGIRGLLVGSFDQTPETLRNLDSWARLLGIIAFLALGLGLDIAAGITGALSWSKLSTAMPYLKQYRLLEISKRKIAGIKQSIGRMPQFTEASSSEGDGSRREVAVPQGEIKECKRKLGDPNSFLASPKEYDSTGPEVNKQTVSANGL